MPPPELTYPARLAVLAAADPARPVAVFVSASGSETSLDRATLLRRSRQVARLLSGRGVTGRDVVAVGLGNTPDHLVAMMAIWTLGACVLPVNPRQPGPEREELLAVAGARLAVAEWASSRIEVVSDLAPAGRLSAAALTERVPEPGVAIGSGGSTGRPKVIVSRARWTRRAGAPFGPFALDRLGMSGAATVQLVPGALYNNTPFGFTWLGVFEGHGLVIMERFDAEAALRLIERHRVTFVGGVPTMLRRMALAEGFATRDLSSVRGMFHTGGACPEHVKLAWIERLGAERVFEGYGQTEGVGATVIRGDEWLGHRGSVGRPPPGLEVRILRPDGEPAEAGEIGEVYFRHAQTGRTSRYLGAPPVRERDGFATVSDLGWTDPDGYLYIADRRDDMIVTGAVNVFPAEVEGVLLSHPGVADAAVIGLPDEEWGRRVHAVIEPARPDQPPTAEELDRHCRARLSAYKIPKGFEVVPSLPRDDAGKLRRSALAAERRSGPT